MQELRGIIPTVESYRIKSYADALESDYKTLLMWNIVDDKKGLKVEKNRQGVLSSEVLRFNGDNMEFIETSETVAEASRGFRRAKEPTPFD